MMLQKKSKRICIITGLVGMILFLFIAIGILMLKNFRLYELEKEMYNQLTQVLAGKGEANLDHRILQEMEAEFQQKKQAMDKEAIINGIKGFFIALTVILTGLSTILGNIKNILKDLMTLMKKGKGGKQGYAEGGSTNNVHCPVDTEKRDHLSLDNAVLENNKEIQDILFLINELNKMDKEGMNTEKQELIHRTVTLLIEKLIDNLKETSYFTRAINQDRNQLESGVHEIKKGIEQIAYIVQEKNGYGNVNGEDEIVAAVQQINSVVEEIGLLLLGMGNKVQRLSQKIGNRKDDES